MDFNIYVFYMLYAILQNSLRIFLVLWKKKIETIVKGSVTSSKGILFLV